MSATAPIEPEPAPLTESAIRSWRIRAGRREDLDGIVAGVRELLVELGGDPPPASAMQTAARTLLESPGAGAVLVAEAGEIVGVLAVSWQTAIHVPGRYGLIQDLWVHPSWRSKTIGRDLLTALFELARDKSVARMEVGLPRESFTGLRATEAFYLANEFKPLGARMRRLL